MNIRNKLILMLAIPIAALLIVALWGFQEQSSQSEANEDSREVADSIIDLENLALEVSNERFAQVRLDFGQSGVTQDETVESLREERDTAIAETDALLADLAQPEGTTESLVVQEIRGTLEEARAAGRAADDIAGAVSEYNSALFEIDSSITGLSLVEFDADSVLSVQAVRQARDVINTQESAWTQFFTLAEERNAIAVEDGAAAPAIDLESVTDISIGFGHVSLVANEVSRTELSNGLSAMDAPANSATFRELATLQAFAEQDLFENSLNDLTADEVLPLLITSREEWTEAVSTSNAFVLDRNEVLADQITDNRSLFTLLAVLGTLLFVTLIYVIGRSIIGPLGRLMEHAEVVTQERLPFAVAKLRTLGASDELPELRPIPKESNDEIGSLVDAFNDVQDTAVKVATDQARSRRNVAEMFVSLGRRNQQLNHRMINLISDLEKDEQDTETLAGLYQLDHLATRMRRNAESLLVLAGNRSPRQWSRPVPVEDVLRSSIGEVELFERIDVGDLPELAMQGNVVTDVTHLLAELLDNATQFSEPSTRVSISAQETLEGVEIEIFDEGFGVNEHDLAELNERITNPPALDEAPSRLLGLFVVGRLAQQHNIDVELQSQPGVGTVATVFVPSSLFAQAEVDEDLIQAPAGYVAEAPIAGESVAQEQSDFLAGLDALVVDPSTEVPDLGVPALETRGPVVEAPAVDVEAFGATGIDEPSIVTPVVEAWEPGAVHEETLADASVPTMAEVEEALPSFPGVTIDEPAPIAPAELGATDDSWPLNSLDSAEASPPSTAISQLDSITSEPTLETAFETAPEPLPELPADPAAPATSMIAPVVEPAPAPEATPVADLDPIEPFSIAPPVPEADPNPVSRSLPAPPIVEAAPPAHAPTPAFEAPAPAPVAPAPVAETPAPVAEAPAPAPAPAPAHAAPTPVAEAPVPQATPEPVAEAPVSQPTFGGLPTRAPMATLESAQVKPALIPLQNEQAPTAEEPAPKAAASAFAAFASGVNRGLDKVNEDPEPQFQNEGENT